MKELLDKYSDELILRNLFKLYGSESKNSSGYIKALAELRTTKPKKNRMRIMVEEVEDEGEKYVHVSGVRNHSSFGYAIGLMSWDKWLGMAIDPKVKENNFSDLDILAHCLWEMTFYGYSSQSIQVKMDELEKISEEIKKNETVQNLPKAKQAKEK